MSISKESLVEDLKKMGVQHGDTLFLRANYSSVGLPRRSVALKGGDNPLIAALLEAVGEEGTLVSLAYTKSFFGKAKPDEAYDLNTKSYAGALPNTMLQHSAAKRSRHPMNSMVAIGKHADTITENHDETSPAYEPVRKMMELNAKMMLIGIVDSSPGFTTTHLAEYDLGLHKRVILPKLNQVYYKDLNGELKLFKREDVGLCSNSYRKFYSHYVDHEVLRVGEVGNAYAIMVGANEAYEIDKNVLKNNPKFNICGRPTCFYCNARRWDRIHHLPLFVLRTLLKRLSAKPKSSGK
jgi:aminoglycoside N3'-acetyltransferase